MINSVTPRERGSRPWVALFALVFGLMGCAASANAPSDKEKKTASPPDSHVKAVMTADMQKNMSPQQVLDDLEAGNERFMRGEMIHRDLNAQVDATASGQHPKAIVLGCVDSRVPLEKVFDQGVGDIFAARVAGNFVNDDILGSMEFATKVAGSKVVAVIGHTACGAVKGSCDAVDLGHISSLVKSIKPSVEAVNAKEGAACTSKNLAMVDKVAAHNVQRTIKDIRERSKILSDLEKSGAIKIVGGMYDISTGKVSFY